MDEIERHIAEEADMARVEALHLAFNLCPPGSDKAIAKGCKCPVLDNGHGDPEIGRIRGWYITEGCPLHALGKTMLDAYSVEKGS